MDYQIVSEYGSRDVNEDYAAHAQVQGMQCFVLCDGLGGHGKGEVASELVTNALLGYMQEHPQSDRETIAVAFEHAQAKLLELQEEQHLQSSMKTTAVMLLTDREHAVWAHIGDSRLYLFYRSKIVQRTLDHSVPQMLVMMGKIKEKQIRNHPDRNRLLRVMGTPWGARSYEISDKRSLSKCQAFLLCSDGFWENITEKQMCRFLRKSKTADEWLRLMQEEVRKNGADTDMDNNTAIAVIL